MPAISTEQFNRVMLRLRCGEQVTTACAAEGISASGFTHRRKKLGLALPEVDPAALAAFEDSRISREARYYLEQFTEWLLDPRNPRKHALWRESAMQLLGDMKRV